MPMFAHLLNWLPGQPKWQYGKASANIDESELSDISLKRTVQHLDAIDTKNPHHGWRRVVILATVITAGVTLMNISFATVAFFTLNASRGVGDIFKSDCSLVERWNTVLHLLINVLSTLVLAASSFTMQCLGSPTRNDVDVAHSKGVSLEIGIPSVRNLLHVRHWRRITWLSLCLSTLPLHLFWNSVVFTTVAYHDFNGVVVDEQFLNASNSQYPQYTECLTDHSNVTDLTKFIFDGYAAGNYTNTTGQSCKNDYLRYLSIPRAPEAGQRNFIFVCNITMNLTTTQCNYTDPDGKLSPLNYCFSETKGLPGCTLHYSSYLLYIVAACNIIKLICMCVTAKMLWNDGGYILATVGDATASFLALPDKTTRNRCISETAYHALDTHASPTTLPTRYVRKASVSIVDVMRLQWALSSVFCIAFFSITIALMIFSNHIANTLGLQDLSYPDGLGFVRMIIATNSPQVVLSMTYFACNSFFSAQSAAKEWATYARTRKPLRVTWPRGEQRSTYWLSLPYRYSVPLISLFLLLHFLLSQTIFIGRSQFFDAVGKTIARGTNGITSAIYFSQRYSYATFATAFLLIVYQWMSNYRKFNNRIPCHKSSSAMISAMCHVNDPYNLGKQYTEAELWKIASGPLVWGVTREPIESDGTEGSKDIPGHCSFSADKVTLPVRGKRYE